MADYEKMPHDYGFYALNIEGGLDCHGLEQMGYLLIELMDPRETGKRALTDAQMDYIIFSIKQTMGVWPGGLDDVWCSYPFKLKSFVPVKGYYDWKGNQWQRFVRPRPLLRDDVVDNWRLKHLF
jgi:hypothetical protein